MLTKLTALENLKIRLCCQEFEAFNRTLTSGRECETDIRSKEHGIELNSRAYSFTKAHDFVFLEKEVGFAGGLPHTTARKRKQEIAVAWFKGE
jgi:hypothetical protein